MKKSLTPTLTALLACLLAVFGLAACGDDDTSSNGSGTLTVYSGRDEELVGPLLDAFTEATGIEVEARYDDSANLALLIDTEGDKSPADIVISQSPGALGFLAGKDRLAALDTSILARVPAGLAASDGTWVGLTGRVRTLVYNTDLVDPADLPSSVFDLTKPKYAGLVGVAPTNGSFQDFVTAMRNEEGDDRTGEWLAGMAANGSPNYPKNSAIVEAVGRGEVPMGLVNHYYNLRAIEADPNVASVNHFFPDSDLGALVIVTGAGVLNSSNNNAEAQQLLAFLLNESSQTFFSAETQEYPLVADIPGPDGVPALDALTVDTIDFDLLGDGLQGTQELIRASGIET